MTLLSLVVFKLGQQAFVHVPQKNFYLLFRFVFLMGWLGDMKDLVKSRLYDLSVCLHKFLDTAA